MIPLMVQEAYLKLQKYSGGRDWSALEMKCISVAAKSIADSDFIDHRIRRSMKSEAYYAVHAVLSSIKPGHYAQTVGRMSERMNFPMWMGQNSKRKKESR